MRVTLYREKRRLHVLQQILMMRDKNEGLSPQLHGHTLTQSLSQSGTQFVYQSSSQPCKQSVSHSVSQPINQSVTPSAR